MKATVVSPKELAGELLALWAHLMRGSSQQMFAVLGELELSMTQMKTLSMLDDCLDEISVKELSERLALSLPATSRTVDGLLRRGLLSRHEDAEDRRVKRVRLTDEGRSVVQRIVTARLQGLESYASTLSDGQRAQLMAALSELPHRKDPA